MDAWDRNTETQKSVLDAAVSTGTLPPRRCFVCRPRADSKILWSTSAVLARNNISCLCETIQVQLNKDKTNIKQTHSDLGCFRRCGLEIGTTVVNMVHKQQQAVHKKEERKNIKIKAV